MKLLSGKKHLLLAILIVLFIHVVSYPVFSQSAPKALSPDKAMTQYLMDKWSSEDGLPSNSLNSVIQGYDGYIWITSDDGLIRFDGVKFKTFSKNSVSKLFSSPFTKLCQTKDSTLWIGTEGSGLVSYKKGVFKVFGLEQYKRIEALTTDRQGRIWIGTRGSGVYMYDHKSIEPFQKVPTLAGSSVKAIVQDHAGHLWFGTDNRTIVCFRGDKEAPRSYSQTEGMESDQVLDLLVSPKGILWAGTSSGLYFFEKEKFHRVPGTESYRVNSVWEDNIGTIWLATNKGLVRVNSKMQPPHSVLSEENGLPSKELKKIATDHEGSLWMVTNLGGLCRLKDGKFLNYTAREGLLSNLVHTVIEDGKGSFLVGMEVSSMSMITRDPGNDDVSVYAPLPDTVANESVKHLFRDKQSNLWISTDAGLFRIDPKGRQTTFNKANQMLLDNAVQVTYQDKYGHIWFGTHSSGLAKILGSDQYEIFSRETGFASNYITSIDEDAAGNLLVGTDDAGLQIISDEDGQISSYTIRDGLPGNPVFNTYTDKEGVVWIVTSAGLTRYYHNKFLHFGAKSGLPADAFYDVIEDDLEHLWLTSSKGIIKVDKHQLTNFAEGKLKNISYRRYTHHDGMPHDQCTPYSFATKDSQGRLWFPTLGGIAVIDPARTRINTIKPLVDVTEFLVDNREMTGLDDYIELEPGKKRFIFNFTALSMLAPKKVRFKYRLEPIEKDWVEADPESERHAIYTNLSPGRYTFRVIASNNDGVWNDVGTALRFRLRPYFYQTLWFYGLMGFVFLSGVVATYRWRVRLIQRRNRELQTLVERRTLEIKRQKEEIEEQRDRIEQQRETLEHAFHDIKIVSEIGQRVTSVLRQEDMISTVYENVNSLMHAEVFGIGLFNDRSNSIDYVNYIQNGEKLPFRTKPMNDRSSLAVQCIERREAILINSFDQEYTRYFPQLPENHGERPQSVIYLPLLIGSTPLGVITVQSFQSNVYKERHFNILQTLAAYITIALDNSKAYEIIRSKNHQITDSLRYASSIQQAVLPSAEKMNYAFSDYFIISRPRDIVSGDFYWFNHTGDAIYLAVVDCTGHGVPGAFMSMIGSALLNEIVNIQKIYEPEEILNELHDHVRKALKQEESKNTDGMDVCLCVLKSVEDDDTKTHVTFSGAGRPLYYTRSGELLEIRGDHRTIGGLQKRVQHPFTKHEIVLDKGECLYMCTDGFVDQNAPGLERFGSQRLKEMLRKFSYLGMIKQQEVISKMLDDFQQDAAQRDDITMIGVKV